MTWKQPTEYVKGINLNAWNVQGRSIGNDSEKEWKSFPENINKLDEYMESKTDVYFEKRRIFADFFFGRRRDYCNSASNYFALCLYFLSIFQTFPCFSLFFIIFFRLWKYALIFVSNVAFQSWASSWILIKMNSWEKRDAIRQQQAILTL